MATAAAIVAEINGVRTFFRDRDPSPEADEALKKSFTNTVLKQISACKHFGRTEATLVQEALNGSPYFGEGTTRIKSAIDAKLSAELGNVNPSSDAQKLYKPWGYYTEEDWDVFRDPRKQWNVKLTRGVERQMLVGCRHPDEHSLQRLLAMLLATHYDELPPARHIYDKLQELKACVAIERKPFPHECIMKFPESPKDLPDEIYSFAYSGGVPVHVELPGINMVINKIPLRKNSKLLKDRAPKSRKDREEWASLKNSVEGDDDAMVIHSSDNRLVSSQGLKKFKRERSDEAVGYDDLPHDPEEEALYIKYKADLWKLRAQKKGIVAESRPLKLEDHGQGPSGKLQDPGSLQMHTSPDGALVLQPRVFETTPALNSGLKQGPKEEEDKPEIDDDLDAHSKAALNALKTRNVKRKAAAAAEAKAKRKQKVMKAGTTKKAMKSRARKAMKSIATSIKDEKAAVKEVPAKHIMKSIPKLPKDGSNPPAVQFAGGVIYTCASLKKFRGLKVRGDAYTEVAKTWGVASRTMEEAWKSVTDAIAAHASKKD